MNVTVPPSDHNRLADLLRDPQETLDVEIKGWLDLARNQEHKATLAKALLALANHGGGYVIIGLTETDAGFATASGQPVSLDDYWCFRHQLLLPRHYLVLTKPLRLDIQCQRGASVKIGWKYLDD